MQNLSKVSLTAAGSLVVTKLGISTLNAGYLGGFENFFSNFDVHEALNDAAVSGSAISWGFDHKFLIGIL